MAFDADPAYPPVLFVHSATTDEAREFFGTFWPEARAVSDPEKGLYSSFDLKSGSLKELFGPGVWLKALQARARGYTYRGRIGNVWLNPGIFFVRQTEILWSWKYRNIGDQPDFSEIPRQLPSRLPHP